MKKLTLIVSALAIVLGLSQCAKKPNAPVFGGVVREITFNATGNGAKGDFYQDGEQLRLKWQKGDKLYVYSSENSERFDESTGKYCGALDISSGVGTEEATFKGDIKVNEKIGYLRFVHVGQQIAVIDGAATCDYSTQNGVIAEGSDNIARKVMAHIDLPLSAGEYEGTLKTEYSVIEFKMDFFKGKEVTMTGYTNDKLELNSDGSFVASKSEATSISLGVISNSLYYLIVLPEENTPTYKFNDGEADYEKKATKPVEGGYFYSNSGSPIPVVDDDVLPGLFTVSSAGKKVHFSKGNLRYNAAQNKWSFADNQYDVIGDDNINISETYDGWIDLFGWGTGYATKDGGNKSYPWQNTMCYETNNYYAVGQSKLNDGFADSGNKYDWGHNINGGSTWYTLSYAQWKWLLGPKSNGTISIDPGINCRETEVTINGVTGNHLYAMVKVNGKCGLLIFPDTFTWDEATMGEAPATLNTHSQKWNEVDYSTTQFAAMQDAGIAFLPTTGYRGNMDVSNPPAPVKIYKVDINGNYWSSDKHAESGLQAKQLLFHSDVVNSERSDYRCNGFAVRLVVDDENVSSGK